LSREVQNLGVVSGVASAASVGLLQQRGWKREKRTTWKLTEKGDATAILADCWWMEGGMKRMMLEEREEGASRD
jgi:hypothetical protein